MFVTLYRDGANSTTHPGTRKQCNDFYHPASPARYGNIDTGQEIQVWVQVGSKLVPEYPIKDSTEAYYQLRKTVGHPINIYSRWYHSTKYIIGLDMERISGAGFTGMNTKAGGLLSIGFRDCNVDGAHNSTPQRVFCALHYDAVIHMRSEGVELLD